MDLDQLLARTLQSEEVQQQQQQLSSKQREVLGIVQQNQSKAKSVEDPQLHARARSLMPLAYWRESAREQYELNQLLEPGSPTTAVDDLVVQSMLQWFKRDFFSWVNNPPCVTCGSSSTQLSGMGAPTPQEQPHAGRVEVYNCTVCSQVTRFPRYNSPSKLLETRKGRCGEWAHCFLLMLRAAGYDARHVCDNADHVWNEYWSRALGRWVHVDSCEAAWDTPLLYEGGWGKALGFVLAAAWHGHTDVTRRYVLPTALPQLPTRREGVPDHWLIQALAQATSHLRSHLGQSQSRALAVRDAGEMLQLMSLESGPSGAEAAAAAAAAVAVADLPGRQSGAEAWRQARGETGTPSRPRPAATPPTAFTRTPDTSLPQLFLDAGRVTGGVCRASGQHTGGNPPQTTLRLFDGSLGTKWLDFGGGGTHGTAWVEYRLLPDHAPVVISHYDVICAEDCPERDPCDWVLEARGGSSTNANSSSSTGAGSSSSSTAISSSTVSSSTANMGGTGASSSSSDGGWVVLHEGRGHSFSRRQQLCSFVIPAAARVASRCWRLRVTRTRDPSTASCVQLCCWGLYATVQESNWRSLMYLDDSMCEQLQALAAAAAAGAGGYSSSAGAAAAGVAGATVGSNADDDKEGGLAAAAPAPAAAPAAPAATAAATGIIPTQQEGLSTLRRILDNVSQQHPDPKFFKLSFKSSKMKQLLAQPLLRGAVFAAGFRPVLQEGTVSEPQGQLTLVAPDSSNGGGVQAAARALLKLLDRVAGEGVPEATTGTAVM